LSDDISADILHFSIRRDDGGVGLFPGVMAQR
jgi:hypothetical protein